MTAIEIRGQRQAFNDDVIKVDVTATYASQKELILQDFMDVEYITLDTNKDFVNEGIVMDIGEKFILVKNRMNDGDIFIYDRSGKALRKINNKGSQVSRQYSYLSGIALDEGNNEMFVNDHYTKYILVFDLFGKFKRSFQHKASTDKHLYTTIFNYDTDNLICYYDDDAKSRFFFLVSKKDGRITNEIKIPYKEHISLTLQSKSKPTTTKIWPGLYGSTISSITTGPAYSP